MPRFYLSTLLLVSFFLSSDVLHGQNTFIKRYKNTPIAEDGRAICLLPNNQYAIVGQQANGFAWQAPLIVITDSTGNQIRHIADTACYACDPYDAAADSKGFIYVAGNFFNNAGVLKYDTLGNRIWLKQFRSHNMAYGGFSCIDIINDSLIIAGGAEATDSFGGKSALVAFNNAGDTLWSVHFGYGQTVGFNDIAHDSNFIYAAGLRSDTIPPFMRANYLRVNYNGQNAIYAELNNGRKWGYGIIPLSPNTILIGGRADIVFGNTYSFLSIIDSMGNVLQTIEDSNYLYNNIDKIDIDFDNDILYIHDYDTIYSGNNYSYYNHIGAYHLPTNNINQPDWEKTITGTTVVTSFSGLKLAKDHTIMQTTLAVTNCPYCPYLLKADSNTCADIVTCDTAFVSSVVTMNEDTIHLKIYPNPVTSDYVTYELSADTYISSVEVSGFDLSGREIQFSNNQITSEYNFYKGRLLLPENTVGGMYLLKFRINGRQNIYGRVIKMK